MKTVLIGFLKQIMEMARDVAGLQKTLKVKGSRGIAIKMSSKRCVQRHVILARLRWLILEHFLTDDLCMGVELSVSVVYNYCVPPHVL